MIERQRLAGRLRNLEQRAVLNAALRSYFAHEGFIEIEAPLLVPSPGLELHLDAFAVEHRYLITSPEYQMKRLLAGGLEKIYSLGKVFRRGELGPHHNPEFTMLEWYRANAGWEPIAADVEALVKAAARAVGCTRADLQQPWDRVSVREAMARWAGVTLDGDEPADELRRRVRHAGWRAPDDGDFSDVFFTVFLDAVEPQLGRPRPVVLYDWPAPLCALARRKPGDPRVVERFEAYAQIDEHAAAGAGATPEGAGATIELCNGFGELTDPVEQRARLEADLAERRRRGLPEYPIDERFLSALGEMPPSGGVALGVDRLAMLLLGARDIREVLPFKLDEL